MYNITPRFRDLEESIKKVLEGTTDVDEALSTRYARNTSKKELDAVKDVITKTGSSLKNSDPRLIEIEKKVKKLSSERDDLRKSGEKFTSPRMVKVIAELDKLVAEYHTIKKSLKQNIEQTTMKNFKELQEEVHTILSEASSTDNLSRADALAKIANGAQNAKIDGVTVTRSDAKAILILRDLLSDSDKKELDNNFTMKAVISWLNSIRNSIK